TVSTAGGQRGRRMAMSEVDVAVGQVRPGAAATRSPRVAAPAAPRRLVLVSNRVGPIGRDKPSQGGLAVAVRAALERAGGLWFGFSGSVSERPSEAPKLVSDGPITAATLDLSRRDY